MKGLVLAGGKSSRFGSDKALAYFEGRRFIEIAVSQVSSVTSEVCISLSKKSSRQLIDAASTYTDCIIYDKEQPCGGPVKGILSSLETLRDDIVYITVDHPYLKPDTLAEFYRRAWIMNSTAATIISDKESTAQSIGYVSKRAADYIRRVCRVKRGKTRLIDIYRLPKSLFIGWSLVTSDPSEFTNVNEPRFHPQINRMGIDEIFYFNHDYFLDFVDKFAEGNYMKALALLLLEEQLYMKLGSKFLLKYVYKDIDYLLSRPML